MTKNIPCHKDDIPRLNRISGQIEGVKKMIEEGRYCPEILSQLRAVRSAVKSVEVRILERHLKHCVAQSFATDKEKDKKIDELLALFNRYED
jgi:DNA-binding FrmR family transcriptional regulator